MSKEEQLREAAQEFIDRCDRGEIRSKHTYEKFKAILSQDDGVRKYTGVQIFAFMEEFIYTCQKKSPSIEYGKVEFFVNAENWHALQSHMHRLQHEIGRVDLSLFQKITFAGTEVSLYRTYNCPDITIVYFPKNSQDVIKTTL